MYHQQQQQLQGHNKQHLSSRPSLPPSEKQFLLQGGGDSGLILSTDAKPRLKWTPELHERFVEAVNLLGGSEKATPKTIMKLMEIPGLTLYHLKSHLQKYRLSKNLQARANAVHAKQNASGCRTATDKICEGNGSPASHFTSDPQINRSMHISEALQMQIEVQRRLHEQLEVQRHVQLRIEAQGKYLESVLEKAREALAKQKSVDDGLEDAASFEEFMKPVRQRTTPREMLGTSTAIAATTTTKQQQQHGAGVMGDGSSADSSCLTAAFQFERDERDDVDDDMLCIGLCTAASWGRRGEEEGRRPSVGYDINAFLEEEPSGGGASPDVDRKTSTSSCRRPRDHRHRIDLNNGSNSWD